MPLNLTDFNQFYVINKICGQEKQRHYLESLGFVPGARISILSELHGYYLVMVKGSKIGLDKSLAKKNYCVCPLTDGRVHFLHTHLESMEYYGKRTKNHQTVLSADRILRRFSDIAASAFQAWAGSPRLCASDYPYAARLRLCTDAYRLSEKPDPPFRL